MSLWSAGDAYEGEEGVRWTGRYPGGQRRSGVVCGVRKGCLYRVREGAM